MSTNAHGKDFWIGQIWHSKDKRESARHVVISDIRSSKAVCHNALLGSDGKMEKRSSRIALKTLAERWECCVAKNWQACAHERMSQ